MTRSSSTQQSRSERPPPTSGPVPTLNQRTEEVLRELGYGDRVAELRTAPTSSAEDGHVTVRMPCMVEWMLQWNLYVPALLGAVKVAVLPAGTFTLKLPSSAVTVWVGVSLFVTVTVLPAFTGDGEKVKLAMLIPPPAPAGLVAAGLFAPLLPLLLHAESATASPATRTTMLRRRGSEMCMDECTESVAGGFSGRTVRRGEASAGLSLNPRDGTSAISGTSWYRRNRPKSRRSMTPLGNRVTVALDANGKRLRLPARLVVCKNRTRRPISGRTICPSDVSWRHCCVERKSDTTTAAREIGRVREPNETADYGQYKSPIYCLAASRKAARRLNATVPFSAPVGNGNAFGREERNDSCQHRLHTA
jgi:hypothetical protein